MGVQHKKADTVLSPASAFQFTIQQGNVPWQLLLYIHCLYFVARYAHHRKVCRGNFIPR
jgi:hypothetical protein